PLLLRLPPSPASHGNVRYAQAGASDDQGLYLYVPVASHVLGVKDPLVTLRWLYIVCFFIPLVLYPLVFFRLFGSPVAGLFAPFPLMICAAELFLRDIYWIYAWSTLALLPLLMLLHQRWPRRGLLLALLIMVAVSFATSIRSQAGLPVLLAAVLVLLARPWSWPRRLTGIGLLAVAYLSISTFGLA